MLLDEISNDTIRDEVLNEIIE